MCKDPIAFCCRGKINRQLDKWMDRWIDWRIDGLKNLKSQSLDAVWRGPFWAQAVNQKRQYLQIRIYKSVHFRPCRSCRKSQKVPTMLFCPVRIPSNARVGCSDRRLWPFDPKCALADLAVELWWPDSTPTCDVPSGVRAIAPHSKTGPQCCLHTILDHGSIAAADAKSWTRIFHWWRMSCHSNDQSVSEGGATIERHSFRNETSSFKRWSL